MPAAPHRGTQGSPTAASCIAASPDAWEAPPWVSAQLFLKQRRGRGDATGQSKATGSVRALASSTSSPALGRDPTAEHQRALDEEGAKLVRQVALVQHCALGAKALGPSQQLPPPCNAIYRALPDELRPDLDVLCGRCRAGEDHCAAMLRMLLGDATRALPPLFEHISTALTPEESIDRLHEVQDLLGSFDEFEMGSWVEDVRQTASTWARPPTPPPTMDPSLRTVHPSEVTEEMRRTLDASDFAVFLGRLHELGSKKKEAAVPREWPPEDGVDPRWIASAILAFPGADRVSLVDMPSLSPFLALCRCWQHLRALDLSRNELLTGHDLQALDGCLVLDSLNVSECPQLETLIHVKGVPSLARIVARKCGNITSASPLAISSTSPKVSNSRPFRRGIEFGSPTGSPTSSSTMRLPAIGGLGQSNDVVSQWLADTDPDLQKMGNDGTPVQLPASVSAKLGGTRSWLAKQPATLMFHERLSDFNIQGCEELAVLKVRLPKVTVLDLAWLPKLSGIDGSLDSLLRLDISHCQSFEVIPAALFKVCPLLQVLLAEGCRLLTSICGLGEALRLRRLCLARCVRLEKLEARSPLGFMDIVGQARDAYRERAPPALGASLARSESAPIFRKSLTGTLASIQQPLKRAKTNARPSEAPRLPPCHRLGYLDLDGCTSLPQDVIWRLVGPLTRPWPPRVPKVESMVSARHPVPYIVGRTGQGLDRGEAAHLVDFWAMDDSGRAEKALASIKAREAAEAAAEAAAEDAAAVAEAAAAAEAAAKAAPVAKGSKVAAAAQVQSPVEEEPEDVVQEEEEEVVPLEEIRVRQTYQLQSCLSRNVRGVAAELDGEVFEAADMVEHENKILIGKGLLTVWPTHADGLEAPLGDVSPNPSQLLREAVRAKLRFAVRDCRRVKSAVEGEMLAREEWKSRASQGLADSLHRADLCVDDYPLLRSTLDAGLVEMLPDLEFNCFLGCGSRIRAADYAIHEVECPRRRIRRLIEFVVPSFEGRGKHSPPTVRVCTELGVCACELDRFDSAIDELKLRLRGWDSRALRASIDALVADAGSPQWPSSDRLKPILQPAEDHLKAMQQRMKLVEPICRRGNVKVDYRERSVHLLQTLPFARDQAVFLKEGQADALETLRDLADVLQHYQQPMVVEGHTGGTNFDDEEKATFYQELADNRAKVICKHLEGNGVQSGSLVPKGVPGGSPEVKLTPLAEKPPPKAEPPPERVRRKPKPPAAPSTPVDPKAKKKGK